MFFDVSEGVANDQITIKKRGVGLAMFFFKAKTVIYFIAVMKVVFLSLILKKK